MSQPILLVDDDSVFRLMVKRFLGSEFDVLEADCLEEARHLLARQSFSCVLLDYRLPDGNGLQILPELVLMDLPVVMLTGMGNEKLALQAIQHGCQAYLIKDDLTRDTLIDSFSRVPQEASEKRQALREQIVFPQIVQTASRQCRETTAALRQLLRIENLVANENVQHLNRLSHLMQGVLTYARILSTGWLPEPMSLTSTIDQALEGIDRSTIPVELKRISQPLPALQSDADAVKAIVQNLLEFAVQQPPVKQGASITMQIMALNLEACVQITISGLTTESSAESPKSSPDLIHPEFEVSRLLVEKLRGRLWLDKTAELFRICFALPYQEDFALLAIEEN
ncbi:response regulator [Bremerella cremea]|nr:response regulator [Bremerella cremea]